MLARFAKKIDNASERSVIFAPLMLPMIVVTMFEVVARYVFNAPTIWANELTQHIFGVYFVIGGAYTLLHDSHAKIDVLYLRLTPRKRAILDCVTYLVFFFPFIVLLLWQIMGQAWLSTVRLQGTGTFWNSPVWPTRWGLVLATLWLLVQGLANYIRIVKFAVTGRQEL